jgi:hypothetical protein
MEWRLFIGVVLLMLLLLSIIVLAYKIDNTSVTLKDASGSTITVDAQLGYMEI